MHTEPGNLAKNGKLLLFSVLVKDLKSITPLVYSL